LVHVVPVPQALPHLPQFSLSVDSSTHVLPHALLPPLHVTGIDPSGFDVSPSVEASGPPPSSPKLLESSELEFVAHAPSTRTTNEKR
jgi:hypothetical protein